MQERLQTEIRDGNGREFANEAEQRNYIVDHFANSFRKNPNEPENLEGCIENFLGPVVLNHPLIRSLKIDDREKNILESGMKKSRDPGSASRIRDPGSGINININHFIE